MSTQEDRFADIAAAIREKDGTAAPIKALDFAARIRAIETGGGGASFAVPLVVTVDAGAAVTTTNGDTTLTAIANEEKTASFILTAPGVWTVTAALNGIEKSKEIEVIDGYTEKFSLSQRLPDGYQEVEYIDSGTTQYIISLVKPTATIKATMDVEPLSDAASATGYFFTADYLPSSKNYYFFDTDWRKTGVRVATGYHSGSITSPVISADTTKRRMKIVVDYPNKKALVEGESEIALTNTSISSRQPYITFPSRLAVRLYSFKIELGGVLTRDFVPCIDPSGVVGVYDLVEGKFYNSGTGTFVAGPAV